MPRVGLEVKILGILYYMYYYYYNYYYYYYYYYHYYYYISFAPFQDYFSSYETGQSVGGRKWENPEKKPPDTPASRTCLVSHVASAGLEPTLDTAVR